MDSRFLAAAGVAALVLIAGCAGPIQSQSPTGDAPSGQSAPTVTVDATAETSAQPDRALVRVAVVTTAPDADAARRQVAENVSRMRDALRDAGVDSDRVHTTSFTLDAVHEERPDSGRITGYRAAHGFEIETSVDRAGTVLDAAVAGGANRVEGVVFTLTPETRRQLRQEALGIAVDRARDDATAVANASGLSITGIESISTSEGGFRPFDARLEADAGGGATVFDPGPVRVSATVSVTYRAEE